MISNKSEKPIKILIIVPGTIASVTISILLPLVELEKQGAVKLKLCYSHVFHYLTQTLINWCDIAVFCRNSEIHDLKFLYKLKQKQKKIIYDIDDNFFEISLATELGRYHRDFSRLYVIKKFFELANITRVYSPKLYELSTRLEAKASLKNTYFSLDIIENLPEPPKSKILKIAYPTGRIDEPALEQMFFQVLKNILEKYRDKIELHLWRKKIPSILEPYSKHIIVRKVSKNYEEFIRKFYSMGFSIGLAPLLDSPFYHAKTNTKYRDLGSCKVAGVYTNVVPYSQCIVNYQTGLLVNNTLEDWENKISELIENEDLRNTVTQNAFKDIQENYKFEDFINIWKEDLQKLMALPLPPILLTQKKNYVSKVICCSSLYEPTRLVIHNVTKILNISFTFTKLLEKILSILHKGNIKPDNAVYIRSVKTNFDLEILQLNNLKFAGVILDCTQFKEKNLEKLMDIHNSRIMPIYILADINKISSFNNYPNLKSNCFFVKTGKEDYYRLDGYHAAYLTILETNFSFTKKNIDIIKRYNAFWQRGKSFWILVKWLFGLRTL